MKSMQQARGVADVRTLHVPRVRTTLSLNRQQHFLDAYFLNLKANRLKSTMAELDRRRERAEGQLSETRRALAKLFGERRVDSPVRGPSGQTMRIDY